MLPRPAVPLTPEDKAVCVKWSCRMLGIWAVIVIATLTLPIFRGESANVSRGQARDHAAPATTNIQLAKVLSLPRNSTGLF
jgi:hypothetical protein